MAKEFHEKYPQYEIEEVSLPFAQYWDKMTADCAADCPPDIMMHNATKLGSFIELGEIEPLDNLWDEETEQRLKNDFLPAQSEAPIVVDGKTYALYMMLTSHQLMYNEKLLEEAGIEVPTTTEEFIEAAIALTNAPEQYGYGFMTVAGRSVHGRYIHVGYRA